jgi:hypothetical protein
MSYHMVKCAAWPGNPETAASKEPTGDKFDANSDGTSQCNPGGDTAWKSLSVLRKMSFEDSIGIQTVSCDNKLAGTSVASSNEVRRP